MAVEKADMIRPLFSDPPQRSHVCCEKNFDSDDGDEYGGTGGVARDGQKPERLIAGKRIADWKIS